MGCSVVDGIVGRPPVYVADEWPYGQLALPSWKDTNWAAQERAVSLRGHTSINYVDLGSCEDDIPLLLLHGIGASYRTWLSMLPALSRSRRVIALDLPGFGRSDRPAGGPLNAASMAEYLDEFCGRLGLGQVDVVGHSMGGFAALQLARSFPKRLHRLGLISASLDTVLLMYRQPIPTLLREPGVCLRFCQQMITASVPLPRSFVRLVMDTPALRSVLGAPYVYDPSELDPDTLYEAFSSSGRLMTFATAMMGFLYSFEELADGLATQMGDDILIIVGAEDRLTTNQDAGAFSQRLGQRARTFVLERTGHWPMLERPLLLNKLIIEWLAEKKSTV